MDPWQGFGLFDGLHLQQFTVAGRFRRQRTRDRGIGYERVMFAPKVLDTAVVNQHIGIRFQLDLGLNVPDRSEYFWNAGSGNNGRTYRFLSFVPYQYFVAMIQWTPVRRQFPADRLAAGSPHWHPIRTRRKRTVERWSVEKSIGSLKNSSFVAVFGQSTGPRLQPNPKSARTDIEFELHLRDSRPEMAPVEKSGCSVCSETTNSNIENRSAESFEAVRADDVITVACRFSDHENRESQASEFCKNSSVLFRRYRFPSRRIDPARMRSMRP